MVFEVIGSDGQCKMVTEYESCIPYEYIDSMSKSGYKFRIDGKIVSKMNIRAVIESKNNIKNLEKPASIESKSSRQVRCIDTGKVYKNQSEAAKDLNIDPAQVSDSIKTGRPRSGYRFERVV